MHSGLELKGHFVYINPSDFSVLLDSPYGGIEAGSHTPYFAMFRQNRNVVDGVITEKCLRAGEKALVVAYEEANFLFRNRDTLYKRILAADREVASIQRKVDSLHVEYSNEKKHLKALFKSGELPESEYSSCIRKGESQIEVLNSSIETIWIHVFSGFSEYTLPYGHEKQALAFVRTHSA
jgi:hypothetical protein